MKSIFTLLLMLGLTAPGLAQDIFAPEQGSNPFAAEQQPSFLPVEQAYQSTLSLAGDRLSLDWRIAEGYYLYRDRFAFTLNAETAPTAAEAIFSPGKVKDDPYFGRTEVYYHSTLIEIALPEGEAAFTLDVVSQGCADAGLCYPPQTQRYRIGPGGEISQIDLPDPAASPAPSAPGAAVSSIAGSLLLVLLFAALGGAILNFMPCVFPVLGLKVLSFAQSHHGKPAGHGLSYSAGVVSSFVLVAGVLVALQQGGQAVGWGFQLQTPWFVAALATLFFVLGLNLLGIFEIGGSWMNIGQSLSQEGGYRGSFFTGVLATLVASPCTAPFMGTAVGFAATQSAPRSLLIFAVLGAGMALPVLLLTLFPRWLKLLPKPGQWMLLFRQLLAFPLLATAIWLVWVLARQTGANSMAAALSAWLLIGFAIWLWPLRRRGKLIALLSLLAAGYLLATGVGPAGAPGSAASPAAGSGSFDRRQIDSLRASGKNVFLDVTADWCITCAANESLVLHRDDMQAAFAEHNVVYLVADWTRYDPAITALLAEYQRNGIPLYVYYPADLAATPQILPQILTRSRVLSAIGAN